MNKVDEEKRCLNLINSMDIIETDCDCGEMLYALVENNEKNRNILHEIGLTDKEIEEECYPEDDTLDISSIAFYYADWFYKGMFVLNKDLPKEAKANE